MSTLKTVGAKLLVLRGDKRREEVAAAIKISLSALASYELGLRTPRDKIKRALADYYGTSVQDIFFQ